MRCHQTGAVLKGELNVGYSNKEEPRTATLMLSSVAGKNRGPTSWECVSGRYPPWEAAQGRLELVHFAHPSGNMEVELSLGLGRRTWHSQHVSPRGCSLLEGKDIQGPPELTKGFGEGRIWQRKRRWCQRWSRRRSKGEPCPRKQAKTAARGRRSPCVTCCSEDPHDQGWRSASGFRKWDTKTLSTERPRIPGWGSVDLKCR